MSEQGAHVLYIEDDPDSRRLVRGLLKKSGYRVSEAADGMGGLREARANPPDLILIDIHLPDINGTELATKLKGMPGLGEAVLVALTGMDDQSARDLALTAGCDGFISKPIDPARFPEQVREFLQGKREQVSSERRDRMLRHYQQTLVDHLTEKVEELQRSHGLLEERTNRLKVYSRDLERLLFAFYRLQLIQSPQTLKSALIAELVSRFQFDRCAYFKVDTGQRHLYVKDQLNFADGELDDVRIPYDPRWLDDIFRNRQIAFFPDPRRIGDRSIRRLLKKLDVGHFVVAAFGATSTLRNRLALSRNLESVVAEILPSLPHLDAGDRQQIETHLENYLASDIFAFGGYFIMDYKDPGRKFTRNDVRLLEMLLNSAGLLYQNLLLREQLQRLFVRAEREAITDHLTGLYNYRYFTQQLEREISRTRRHKSPFVLLMLDIDFFKTYNDTHGHPAGDRLLQRLAELFRANTRGSDFVARYGGEEFAIICPELDRNGGRQIAEKLCRMVDDTSFDGESALPHPGVTISIGVAAYPDDADCPDHLIARADAALYRAKANGRNRVCYHVAAGDE